MQRHPRPLHRLLLIVIVFDEDGRYVRTEGEGGAPGTKLAEKVKPDPYADLTPDQRYVAELKELGRVRLAARADIGGRVRGWLEWIDDSGESVEYIEVAAVEALGYSVTWASYGVRLAAGKHVIIATPWPHQAPIREREQRLYNLSGGGTGIASGASEAGAAAAGGIIGYAPGQRADVFPANPAKTISGYTPPTSTL